MDNSNNKLSELLSITLLLLCVILFFIKIPYSGKSLFGSDFLYYFYPIKRFIRGCLSERIFPFWNPYLFSGSPFIANIQASMFYPLGFLYYLISQDSAYLYTTILHFALGSLFMYAFMRDISISQAGSLVASFVFSFNGFLFGHLYAGHLSFIQNYIWIPLVFLFLLRFFNAAIHSDINRSIIHYPCGNKNPQKHWIQGQARNYKLHLNSEVMYNFKYAVITGIVLGVQFLGGFPQIAFYTILGTLAFGFFKASQLIKKKNRAALTRVGVGMAIVIIVSFLLSAVQLLPTLELSSLTTRARGVNYAFATSDSLHPKDLLTFLLPDIFGNVVDGTYWRTGESWHFWETCSYVGLIPFFLIFFRPKSNHHRSLWLFFIAVLSASLFIAIGKYNPFYHIIYRFPGFNSFRIPAQIIYLYIFGMAVLSGIGLHRLEEKGVSISKSFLFFMIFLGAILSLSLIWVHFVPHDFFYCLFKYFSEGPIKNIDFSSLRIRTITGIDKAGLIFFTFLLLLLLRKNQKMGPRIFSMCLLLLLMMDLGIFGLQFIKPYDYKNNLEKEQIARKLNKNPYEGRIIALTPFYPNDGMIYRFPSILGYDPLILMRYANYIQASQNWPLDNSIVNLAWVNNPSSKLLKMLNVRRLIYMDDEIEIDNDVPYINFIQEPVFKSENDILSFMQSDEFDPKRMVVFEKEYQSIASSYGSDEGGRTAFSVIEYSLNNIMIDIYSEKPRYLVLSEIYYPGWQARVDGEIVPILCGNYIFRAIPVDKGAHRVSLCFIPTLFHIGMIISLLTLIICLFYLCYASIKRKKI